MNENFVTVLKHSIEDRGFIEGKDFIGVDTNEYYILLPFVFEILCPFSKFYGSKYKLLHHCVANEKQYFKNYYDEQFVKIGRLKCFFFNKKTKITDMEQYAIVSSSYTRPYTLCEFTCWLDENDEHIHLFHNFYNSFDFYLHDRKIYNDASIIIKKLKPIIFNQFKKYNYKEIIKNYKNKLC